MVRARQVHVVGGKDERGPLHLVEAEADADGADAGIAGKQHAAAGGGRAEDGQCLDRRHGGDPTGGRVRPQEVGSGGEIHAGTGRPREFHPRHEHGVPTRARCDAHSKQKAGRTDREPHGAAGRHRRAADEIA